MKSIILTFSVLLVPALTLAQQSVLVRIVDIGAGLCSVTKVSGPEGTAYMVFDAGSEHPFDSQACLNGVREVVGDASIDVMIISHSDADHLADADDILTEFEVQRIVRTGYRRNGPGPWRDFDQAVETEVQSGAVVRNLADDPLRPGEQIQLAGATLTLVAGWSDWIPHELFDEGESRNVISIVARLEYDNRSVLFTGDTIGRRKTDGEAACKNAEEFMVANSASVPIRSNVMIAPHHGGNNGSSGCFITAVFGEPAEHIVPRYVVFPAGHAHSHPGREVVERYRVYGGIGDNYMFRTDRGDNEAGPYHDDDSYGPCRDTAGDDTVEISWAKESRLQVRYVSNNGACATGQ